MTRRVNRVVKSAHTTIVLEAIRAGHEARKFTLPESLYVAVCHAIEPDTAFLPMRVDLPRSLSAAKAIVQPIVAALEGIEGDSYRPKTIVGRGIRTLRNALDRKALAALMCFEELDADITVDRAPLEAGDMAHALLEVRGVSWRAACAEGWVEKSKLFYKLSPLGAALWLLLKSCDRDKISSVMVIEWRDLLEGA